MDETHLGAGDIVSLESKSFWGVTQSVARNQGATTGDDEELEARVDGACRDSDRAPGSSGR